MTKLMLTKQLGNWGLGIGLNGKEKVTSFTQGGSNEGYKCILFAYLEIGQGAVVMTNGDHGSPLFNEILRAIAREYGWPDYQLTEKAVAQVDPASYQSYIGEYDSGGIPVTITTEAGQLYILASPLGPQRVRLYPFAENRFFILNDNIEVDIDVNFIKDKQGNVTELQSQAAGETVTAKKMK